MKFLKILFLGGNSGGDWRGGGEAIHGDAAGVHMRSGDHAGATFGSAGVGGLPAAAGIALRRRSAACAFSIGEVTGPATVAAATNSAPVLEVQCNPRATLAVSKLVMAAEPAATRRSLDQHRNLHIHGFITDCS